MSFFYTNTTYDIFYFIMRRGVMSCELHSFWDRASFLLKLPYGLCQFIVCVLFHDDHSKGYVPSTHSHCTHGVPLRIDWPSRRKLTKLIPRDKNMLYFAVFIIMTCPTYRSWRLSFKSMLTILCIDGICHAVEPRRCLCSPMSRGW